MADVKGEACASMRARRPHNIRHALVTDAVALLSHSGGDGPQRLSCARAARLPLRPAIHRAPRDAERGTDRARRKRHYLPPSSRWRGDSVLGDPLGRQGGPEDLVGDPDRQGPSLSAGPPARSRRELRRFAPCCPASSVARTTAEVDFPAPPFGLAKTIVGMRGPARREAGRGQPL